MNREETLEAIQKARQAHEAQMAKIKSVIEGNEVKNPTALSDMDLDKVKL